MNGLCTFGAYTVKKWIGLKTLKTGTEILTQLKQNKMKTNLDLATKLHYELNLDNFFNVDITKNKVTLLGYYNEHLERILFDKGYQVQWDDFYKNYIFESENIRIVLAEPSII
jgi:hypothetical protein